MKCDFEGYVTKNDIRCMDGRIIRKDAFKENDKMSVPLVWQHRHDSPENVLGHMELENREDGVYGYGFFNNTDMAATAKELVKNRDIRNMSIYANHLVEQDKNVTHGSIKEVSLVLAGANPGAVINHVSIAHSDGYVTEIDDECDIFTDEEIFYHADEEEAVEESTEEVLEDDELAHADEEPEENQNEGEFGKAFSEMTKEDYESLLADLDEIEEIAEGLIAIGNGKKIKHDAFEEDEELALIHYASPYYDPKYAHEYYMAHRKLKGRQRSAYKELNEQGRHNAQTYKSDRNRQRDKVVDASSEATKNNIEIVKKRTAAKRKELRKILKDRIKSESKKCKEDIKRAYENYKRRIESASSETEKDRLRTDAAQVGEVYKLYSNRAKKSLEKAYKADSKALTKSSRKDISEYKENFDKTKLKEMKDADNDYTDYIENLSDLGGFTKHDAEIGFMTYIHNSNIDAVTNAEEEAKRRRIYADSFKGQKPSIESKVAEWNADFYERDAKNIRDMNQDSYDYIAEQERRKKKMNDMTLKALGHSYSDEEDDILIHEDSDETVADIMATLDDKQRKAAAYIIAMALASDDDSIAQDDFEDDIFDDENYISHEDDSDETIGDIFNTFNEKQKNCVLYLVSQALENKENIEHSDEGGNDFMKHNIFENDTTETNVLTHDDFSEIIADAKKSGSLKDAFLAHAGADYGFGPYTPNRDSSYDGKYGPTEGIDILFPDARLVDKKIEMLRNNPTDWVVKVMNGVHKSPFSRIKMLYADITGDDARAKGYVTGTKKVSEIIALLHRTTAPTTIYKMQKLDRDDIIDITDFDVVAWLKAEMRIMLEEEIARQILVGDFRAAGDSAKINADCVRPIISDTSNDLYAMRYSYAVSPTENEYERFIDECCLAMIDYEGTGSPTLYTTPEYVGHMLLVKDTLGNRIYKTKSELASACGVKEIVEVPYMKDATREEDLETVHSMGFTDAQGNECLCKGIIVNLTDYTVGADKGGAVNMFDDFDIDFNQYKYLIETRISGSLTKPKSAIVIGVQQGD